MVVTYLYRILSYKLCIWSDVFNYVWFKLNFLATNKSQKGNQRDDRALVTYDDLF